MTRWLFLLCLLFTTILPATPVAAEMHPGLGRFMQRDPMGYVDGPLTYQYERNSPVWWLDPSGTEILAQTACDPEGGPSTTQYRPEVQRSCTKACTEAHEAVHRQQYDAPDSCCRRLQRLWKNASPEERKKLAEQFNNWQKANERSIDFPAYQAEYPCLTKVGQSRNCFLCPITRDTTLQGQLQETANLLCCETLWKELENAKFRIDFYQKQIAAGGKATDCPF